MKRLALLSLLVASLALIGIGVAQLVRLGQSPGSATTIVNSSPDGVARMEVSTLAERLRGGEPPLVWELRSAESFAESHIPGSVLVAYEQIEMLAVTLDHGRPIVTLCA